MEPENNPDVFQLQYEEVIKEIEKAKSSKADIAFVPFLLPTELVIAIASKGYDIELYVDPSGDENHQYTVIHLSMKGDRPKVTMKVAQH